MKRKVIQIANSTHLVSLPRKWALRNNIVKGQEIDVSEDGERIIVSNTDYTDYKKAQIDITALDLMTPRVIHALYKKGIDELKITYDDTNMIEIVHQSLGKESQGFEILEHGKNYCVIKNVSGTVEEFNPLLRRTFILMKDMADRVYDALKTKDYSQLHIISHMEETNNRFTTICRRYLNKRGFSKVKYVGPLYYIIEDLENLADQYKYLCQFFYDRRDDEIKIQKEVLEIFEESNKMIDMIIETYYRFDMSMLVKVKKNRKNMIENAVNMFSKTKNQYENILIHHSVTILQKLFCMIGPILILNVEAETV